MRLYMVVIPCIMMLEVSKMKSIWKPIAIIAILTVVGFGSLLFLPFEIGSTICLVCYWAIRITIIAYLLWFFWPYIKRGINYLVQHRED